MASFISESDSNTFTGEKIHHLSYCFFSLTTDTNRVSQNPLVPAAPQKLNNNFNDPGVGVDLFLLLVVSIPFISTGS